jgi:hypothetical protein
MPIWLVWIVDRQHKEVSFDEGLFKETHKQIHLTSSDEVNEPIIISNGLKEFKVIGVEYTLISNVG